MIKNNSEQTKVNDNYSRHGLGLHSEQQRQYYQIDNEQLMYLIANLFSLTKNLQTNTFSSIHHLRWSKPSTLQC